MLTLTISSFSEPNAEYVITVRAHNNKGDGQPKYQTAKTSEEEGKELITNYLVCGGDLEFRKKKMKYSFSRDKIYYLSDILAYKSKQILISCNTFIYMYVGGLWCLTPLFKNILVISWWSVLLVEETGLP